MRAMVNIGDYDVPEPSTYNGTTATVVDGGRNTKAVFTGAVIREDVAKVDMTWKFISAKEWATLLSKFSSKRGGAYINSVTFFAKIQTIGKRGKCMFLIGRPVCFCETKMEV